MEQKSMVGPTRGWAHGLCCPENCPHPGTRHPRFIPGARPVNLDPSISHVSQRGPHILVLWWPHYLFFRVLNLIFPGRSIWTLRFPTSAKSGPHILIVWWPLLNRTLLFFFSRFKSHISGPVNLAPSISQVSQKWASHPRHVVATS